MAYRIVQKSFFKVLDEIKIHNKIIIRKITQAHEHEYDKRLWATSLYLSVLDLTENIIYLLGGKKPIAIPGLVRDCIDAYINLLNIIKRYDYFIRGEKWMLCETKNELQKLKKEDLELLSNDELVVLASLIQECKTRATILSAVTPKYIQQSKKRKGVELEAHIERFYEVFSNHTHNNTTSLVQRHIVRNGNRCQVSTATTIDKKIIHISLSILLDVLGRTFFKFQAFLGFDGNDNLDNVMSAIKSCKKKIKS